ncbi:RNA polymerase I enhancer binding protein [Chytriomyces hyalinus]|nr:RNA polymerase I enhancer binding protein [Chytriomyces hyalinus]
MTFPLPPRPTSSDVPSQPTNRPVKARKPFRARKTVKAGKLVKAPEPGKVDKPAKSRRAGRASSSGTVSTPAKPKPAVPLPPKPQEVKHIAVPTSLLKHPVPPTPPKYPATTASPSQTTLEAPNSKASVEKAIPPKPQAVNHGVPPPPSKLPATTASSSKCTLTLPKKPPTVENAVPPKPVKHAVPPPPPKRLANTLSSSNTTLELPKKPTVDMAIPAAKKKGHIIAIPGRPAPSSNTQPNAKQPTRRRRSFANTKTKVRNSVLVTTKTPIAEAAAAIAGNSLSFFTPETLPIPHPDSFVKPKNHQNRLLVHSFGQRGDPNLNMPKLQLSFDKGPFTERERRAIKAAVISFLGEHNIDTKHAYEFVDSKRRRAEFGDHFKKFYPSLIATSGVNRTCEQVYRYLRDVLLNENHERAGESWSPEEDAQLTELFEIHGGRWRKISSVMGRVGCRERYRYLEEFMQPHIQKGEWYPEEETRLIHLVLKHHHPKRLPSGTLQDPSPETWVSIALEFHTRTIAQIKEKFFYTDLRARWILAWNAMHPEKEVSNGRDEESDSGEEKENVDNEDGDKEGASEDSEADSETGKGDTVEDSDEESEIQGTGKKARQGTESQKRKRAAPKGKPINLEEFDKRFEESSINFKWSRDLDLKLLEGMEKQKKAHDEAELNWKLLLAGAFTIWPVERLKARWLAMRSRATQHNATCQSAYSEDPSSTPPPRPPSPTMRSHVKYLIKNYDSIYKPSAKRQRKNREAPTVHYPSAEHVENSEDEPMNEDAGMKGGESASDVEMSSVESEKGSDDEEQIEIRPAAPSHAISSKKASKTATSPATKKRKAAEERETEKAEQSNKSKKVKLSSKPSSKTTEEGPAVASKHSKNASTNKKNAKGAKPDKSHSKTKRAHNSASAKHQI